MNIHKLIMLIMVLALILTGCASPAADTTAPVPTELPESEPTSTEPPQPEPVSTEPPESEPVETEPAPVAPVTLRFWSWRLNVDPGFDEIFAKAKAEFEASHPGVTIEAHAEPYEGYVNKMISVLAAGSPPEIIHVPASDLHKYVGEGFFEPIDRYLSDTDVIESFSATQNWCKIDDQYYCVVLEAYGYAALVNEEILAEAGVEWPEGLISAAEFAELGEKLTLDRDNDGVTDVYGMGITTAQELGFLLRTLVFMYANGAHFYDDTGKIDVTRPEVVDALYALKDAYDSGAVPIGMNHNDTRRLFHEEKSAFFIDGTWGMDQALTANPALADKVKVYPLPFPMIVGSVSNLFALPAGGETNDLAWDFIELWTRLDYQEMYAEKLGLPLRRGVVTEELKAEKPWMAVYADALQNATTYIPAEYATVWGEFRDMALNRFIEIVVLNKPVEETLQALQNDLDGLKP